MIHSVTRNLTLGELSHPITMSEHVLYCNISSPSRNTFLNDHLAHSLKGKVENGSIWATRTVLHTKFTYS